MAPFTSYSNEIKFKLCYILFSFIICVYVSFQNSDALYYIFIKPFLLVDANRSFLFTDMKEGFQTTMALALMISILSVLPYTIYVFWIFHKPSLYSYEATYGSFIGWSVWILLGMYGIYKIVLPFLWAFFMNFELSTGLVQIYLVARIESYFNFTCQIFGCGLLFLFVPWILQAYGKSRVYVWFISVLVISFLSPPDVFVQMVLTISACLFFEVMFFVNSLPVN